MIDQITVAQAAQWCLNYNGTSPFLKDIQKKIQNGKGLSPKQQTALANCYLRETTQSFARFKEPALDLVNKLPVMKYLLTYAGDFTFMKSMVQDYKAKGGLTKKQWDNVIKCYQRDTKQYLQHVPPSSWVRFANPIPVVVNRRVAMGIKKSKNLSYGPFTLEVVGYSPTQRNFYQVRINATGSVNVCRVCGKSLTDHNSKVSGIGPVCAKNLGLGNTYKISIQQFMADWAAMVNTVGEFNIVIKPYAFKEGNQQLFMEIDKMKNATATPVAPAKPTPVLPAEPKLGHEGNPYVIHYSPSNKITSNGMENAVEVKNEHGQIHLLIKRNDFVPLRSNIDDMNYITIRNVDNGTSVLFSYNYSVVATGERFYYGTANGKVITLHVL